MTLQEKFDLLYQQRNMKKEKRIMLQGVSLTSKEIARLKGKNIFVK